MGMDYSELKGFVNNFKKATIEFDKFIYHFLIKCANETLAKTKKRTPVDSGGLRRNWFITRVMRKDGELVVYLYNSQDYATYVEYGHVNRNRTNWVDGYFMATLSIEELERKMPARFDREFIKFLNKLELI